MQLSMKGADYLTVWRHMPEVEALSKRGLSAANVIDWNGRPKRQRKPPPTSYWDEFVATDEWYVRELVSDVPAEEWAAAVEDEDFDADEAGEEGDEESEEGEEDEEEDSDYSEGEEETTESDGEDASDEGGDSADDDVARSDASSGSDSEATFTGDDED